MNENLNNTTNTEQSQNTDSHKTAQHKKLMLDALQVNLGIVTQTLEYLKKKDVIIGRRTYYDWLENDPEFKKAVNEMEEISLDFVESQHYKNIEDGKEASIIFHLKTKGKKRGYVPKSQIEHFGKDEGSIDVGVTIDYSKLSKRALKDLAKAVGIKPLIVENNKNESTDNVTPNTTQQENSNN
jgi:hypothetical protein